MRANALGRVVLARRRKRFESLGRDAFFGVSRILCKRIAIGKEIMGEFTLGSRLGILSFPYERDSEV